MLNFKTFWYIINVYKFLGGISTMPMPNEFDSRRRERRRRERLRKKRIRAAVLLIALIGLIALVCVALSTCGGNDENSGADTQTIANTVEPDTAAIPTVAPLSPGSIPPASEQNDLLEIMRNSGQTKRCYLTFDDGPTENITPQVLDVLRRYNVKATFFEVGSLIKANPDTARRVHEEGHLIANHSNGHNYEKLYASTETFINEINECYEAIKEVTGEAEPFRLIRFPGGSYKSSADSYSPVKQECKTTLKENNFYYCDWNALNGDAEGKTKNAQELLQYMIRNLDGEDNVVVLMHDAATKQATVDALGSIIEYFMQNGYTFHRLDDIDYQAVAPVSTSSVSSSETTAPATQSSATSAPSATTSSGSGSASSSTDAPAATSAASGTSNARPTSMPTNSGTSIVIN